MIATLTAEYCSVNVGAHFIEENISGGRRHLVY